MTQPPTLLLVHGAWHRPWCWEKFTPELERHGLPWRTVALPSVGDGRKALGGVADDIAAIEAAVAAIPGDVIVLAHSYGGVPATGAAYPERVKHLIYVGAFLPDAGQSLVSLLPPGPLPPFVVDNGEGTTSVLPELAIETFYADCDAETAAWAASKLQRHNGLCNVTPITSAAWRTIPSTYILLTEDLACPTIVQRQTHSRAERTFEMEGSHSPFLAQPGKLARLVSEVALSARA
jgi:pimeloyl-ACP methyl ester carboxylesterase